MFRNDRWIYKRFEKILASKTGSDVVYVARVASAVDYNNAYENNQMPRHYSYGGRLVIRF